LEKSDLKLSKLKVVLEFLEKLKNENLIGPKNQSVSYRKLIFIVRKK